MLAVAECASAALGRVVGRLPLRVAEEHAQSCEMVGIQMLLLPAERREGGSRRVVMPGLVPRLGVSRAPPLSIIVLPRWRTMLPGRYGLL